MKEFLQVLRRFVPPYKKFLVLSIVFNILSALLNIFSFATLVPILQILFKTEDAGKATEMMAWDWSNAKEVLSNNADFYVTNMIAEIGPTTTLLIIGLFLTFTTFLKTGAYFLSTATIIPIRVGVMRDIRNQLYRKITSLPLSFFSEERKGDIVARMSADVQVVETALTSSVDMLIKSPIAILVCFFTMFILSWKLTIFVLLFIPIAGWIMGSVSRKLKRKSQFVQDQWGEIMTELDETLGGLRVIKAFIAESKMMQRFTRTNDIYRGALNSMAIRQSSAHPTSEFMGTVLIVIVLWFGGWLILGGNSSMDAAMFIYYLVILYSVINPLKDFSKAFYNVPQGLASMDRIDMILKAENNITDPANPKELKGFNEGIEFKDVSFKYKNSEIMVLRDINLRVPKGKTIALVGQSGSGKSTLVDLVPRYHDVLEGQILIDGKDVRDVRINDLRTLIGNVNQEAILFNDTIFNNITFGVENATQAEVEAAAKIANAHDFIMETEQGYQTMIGDRGGRLSGGQRQRLSIARAILKNPPILILDEATSALDTESERLVQEALERLMKSRTTIAIAHRLSTIKNADEICVLHEGQIVERGTHEELIALGGIYKKLNDMQSL